MTKEIELMSPGFHNQEQTDSYNRVLQSLWEACAASSALTGELNRALSDTDKKADFLERENAKLREVVECMVDADPCGHDHHGYCQAHAWFDTSPCPHKRAKIILGWESEESRV